MELLDIEKTNVYIPTTNNKGNMSWEKITKITRHDPSKSIYKIKTKFGREVKVVESKSLLIWNDENKEFEPKLTTDVRIGDYVPVSFNLQKNLWNDLILPYEIEFNRLNGKIIGELLANEELTNNVPDVLIKLANDIKCNVIPLETFLSDSISDSFVVGLIDGYINIKYEEFTNMDKNYLYIGEDEYYIGIVSKFNEELEGISMLLSRYGILSEFSTYKDYFKLMIKTEWLWRYCRLIDNDNQEHYNIIKEEVVCGNYKIQNSNYKIQNDTVLDEIIEIVITSSKDYKKVYDLTIPTTNNFGLANGLQVYDTSEVGYIQRKLVKAMEDCKINYDLTVRNAGGSILQFLYGEDGMSATKLETHKIDYIDMTHQEIQDKYLLLPEDLQLIGVMRKEIQETLTKDTSWEEKSINFFKQILIDRTDFIEKVFKMKYEKSVIYPISFYRLIKNTEKLFHPLKTVSDLHPSDIIDELETLEKELIINKYNNGTKLLGMLIRNFLAPKKCIFDYRLNKVSFEYILQQIRLKFKQAIAPPSEMVGVIAAQSIGEPTTQLSSSGETKIIISGNQMYNGEIGKFIDNILKENNDDVIDLGNDSVVYQPKENYHIIGVTNDEKTRWNRILEISRHKANGNLVKVTTKTGKITTATLSHSFLKRTESKIEPIKGSDLKIGDRIPCAKYIPEIEEPINIISINNNKSQKLDKEFGIFIGSYLADGNINNNNICITKNAKEVIKQTEKIADDYDSISKIRTYSSKNGGINIESQNIHYNDKKYESVSTSFNNKELATFLKTEFETGSFKKQIPAWVFSSNKEFIFGILSGYFNGDGNVNGIPGKQIIRCHSVNEKLIIDMCLLLTYAGIFASKGFEKKTNGGNGLHTLYITQKYAQIFKDLIGFTTDYKMEDLDKVIEHQNREEKHSDKEEYDKIPELGNIIAYLGKKLVLPGQSRTYGRWSKKESIGRKTLQNYITIFEEENENKKINPEYRERINNKYYDKIWEESDYKDVNDKINILKQGAYSDVIWDEIVNLEIIEDNGSYVYDFTVPGNDSFMVDCGVLVHNTLNTLNKNEGVEE
jgi:intein/homing endonuclease